MESKMYIVNFDFAGDVGCFVQFGQLIEDIERKCGRGTIDQVFMIPQGPGGGNPNARLSVKSVRAVHMIARWAVGDGIDTLTDFLDRNVSEE